MKQVQYNISEMERAFECGRNFQLTGENSFTELIEELTPVTPVNEGQQQPVSIDEKFTGGEWKVSGTSKSLQRFHIAANGENICAIFTSIPEAEANARLIAEAKNMRTSLHNFIVVFDALNDLYKTNFAPETIKEAKAILNRIKKQ